MGLNFPEHACGVKDQRSKDTQEVKLHKSTHLHDLLGCDGANDSLHWTHVSRADVAELGEEGFIYLHLGSKGKGHVALTRSKHTCTRGEEAFIPSDSLNQIFLHA